MPTALAIAQDTRKGDVTALMVCDAPADKSRILLYGEAIWHNAAYISTS